MKFNPGQYSLITISGVTVGISLSEMGLSKPLYQDETAFIAERKRSGYYLVANSEFLPTSEHFNWIADLRVAIFFLPILKYGYDSAQLLTFHPMPNWLSNAVNIEALTLDLVNLDGFNLINGRHLRVLILGNVQVNDRKNLMGEIWKLSNLKYLVHELFFTPSEMLEIRKAIPGVLIMSSEEYNKKLNSGAILHP